MNLVLISSEEADQRSLMHYRTKGSKNGERRYQNEDGSLTPLGYMHYAAMYGWGKRMGKTSAERADAKAKQAELKAEQAKIKAEKAHQREQKINRTDKEIEADVKAKIKEINDKTKAAADERAKNVTAVDSKGKEYDVKKLSLGDQTKLAIVDQSQLKEQKEQIKKARDMSDNELQQAINRLQKEKQYSELLNERANREKGPFHQMASKLMQDAAQDLAKKALGVAVDKIIDKAKEKAAFKLADFKDVDPYSLPSDKLKAVANAFNDAANLARNRNVVNNGGLDPNQGGNKNSDQNGNKTDNKNSRNNTPKKESTNASNAQQNDNSNQAISKNQRKKMRSLASSGKSAAEIAEQLGVSESTVRQYAGEQLKRENSSTTATPAASSSSSSSSSSGSDSSRASTRTKTSQSLTRESRKNQIDLKTVKTPERKPGESMADYWDNLLRANGAKTTASTTPKGTVSYLPLSEVKTPPRRENESMADYWERLVDENGKRIKTTAQR